MFAKGFVGFILLIVGISTPSRAELWIFDSRRPIALSDEEHPPRDYFINGGTDQGLKAGLIVTVRRRLTMYDSLENRSPGDLIVPVGKIKIIHSQKGLSVARLHSLTKGSIGPALEDHFLMVGDRLDLGSAESEGDHEAANETLAPQPAPAAEKAHAVATITPTKLEVKATSMSSVEAAPSAQTPPLPAPVAPQEQQKPVPVPQVQ